jgi:hypothetical protein
VVNEPRNEHRDMWFAYDADLLKMRAENATFNGILIGSVVMTENSVKTDFNDHNDSTTKISLTLI